MVRACSPSPLWAGLRGCYSAPLEGDVADEQLPDDDDDDVPENDDARVLSPADKARRAYLARILAIRWKPSEEELREIRDIFPLIYRAHVERVWNRLRRRGLSKDEAKDLTQSIFTHAFKEVREAGFQEQLTAQLNRIVWGKLLNFLRDKKRCPLSIGLPSSGSEPVPKTGPEVLIARALDRVRDREELCVRLRAVLSDKLFMVVELRLLNDLPAAETAEALQITEDAVHARLSRAKIRLYKLAHWWVPPSKRYVVK